METNVVLLSLVIAGATALQCDVPGECYIMTIGGFVGGGGGTESYLDDVELTSLDPEMFPVPECLENLNSLPVKVDSHAGALDYSREFCTLS